MGFVFYYISRCQNTPSKVRHLNIIQKEPNESLQLENTRHFSKKLTQSEKSYQHIRIIHPISTNETFIQQYSKVLNHATGVTHFDIIQAATIWSPESAGIIGL